MHKIIGKNDWKSEKCQIFENSYGKWYTSHLDFRDFPFDPTVKRAITHVAIFSQLEAQLSVKDFTRPIFLELVILTDDSEPLINRNLSDLEREVGFLTRSIAYISPNGEVTRNHIHAEPYVKGIPTTRKEVKDILTTKQKILKSLLSWSDNLLWKNRFNRPTIIIQVDLIKKFRKVIKNIFDN